jgi:hypothetical protein
MVFPLYPITIIIITVLLDHEPLPREEAISPKPLIEELFMGENSSVAIEFSFLPLTLIDITILEFVNRRLRELKIPWSILGYPSDFLEGFFHVRDFDSWKPR